MASDGDDGEEGAGEEDDGRWLLLLRDEDDVCFCDG